LKEASRRRLPKRLPRLERLLVDADVNPNLTQYLRAVGFNVLFATKVKVNYRDDVAVVKWARRHNRIVVAHDKYRDKRTKIRVCQEVYEHGGRVIQIAGGPQQHPLTSVGKILTHRDDWVKFFQDNDGMVLVHQTGMTPKPRAYLFRQIQGQLGQPMLPVIAPKAPRPQRKTKRKPKPVSSEQPSLLTES